MADDEMAIFLPEMNYIEALLHSKESSAVQVYAYFNSLEPNLKEQVALHIQIPQTQDNQNTSIVLLKRAVDEIRSRKAANHFKKFKQCLAENKDVKNPEYPDLYKIVKNALTDNLINEYDEDGYTMLMYMSKIPELHNLALSMVKKGADPTLACTAHDTNFEMTAAWIAANSGNWELVMNLLNLIEDAGIRMHIINAVCKADCEDQGKSILWFAAKDERWSDVHFLFVNGADGKAKCTGEGPDKGKSILWLHMYAQKWKIVKYIMQEFNENDCISEGDDPTDGISVLWLALASAKTPEHWAIIENLLTNTAYIDATPTRDEDFAGISLIYIAAMKQEIGLVRRLADMGADLTSVCTGTGADKGTSLLWFVAHMQDWELFEDLYAKICKTYHPIKVKSILNVTCSANGADKGKSLLWLVAKNNPVLAMRLISAGANLKSSAKNDQYYAGTSVIWWLAYHANTEQDWNYIERLYTKGTDCSAICKGQSPEQGKTVLWFALQDKQHDFAGTLINDRITVSATCTADGYDQGISVLWLSVYYKYWALARMLIDSGALVNATRLGKGEFQGESVLSVLAMRRQWDLLKYALDNNPTLKLYDLRAMLRFFYGNAIESKQIHKDQQAVAELLRRKIENHFNDSRDVVQDLQILFHRFGYLPLNYPNTDSVDIALHDISKVCYSDAPLIEKIPVAIDLSVASKDDLLACPFYRQLQDLIFFYKALYSQQESNNDITDSFDDFSRSVLDPHRFANYAKEYYEALKRNLEELFVLLSSPDIAANKKQFVLQNMPRQIVVCGPGIFNSILEFNLSLRSGDLLNTLAEYRRELAVQSAEILYSQKFKYQDMQIHYTSAFIRLAQQLGYAPSGGIQELEHHDPFLPQGIDSDITIALVKTFNEKYKLFPIITKLSHDFIKEYAQVIGAKVPSAWLSYEKYTEYSDSILAIARRYGLLEASGGLYKTLLEYSDDYTDCRITSTNVELCLVQAFVANLVVPSGDTKDRVLFEQVLENFVQDEAHNVNEGVLLAFAVQSLEAFYNQNLTIDEFMNFAGTMSNLMARADHKLHLEPDRSFQTIFGMLVRRNDVKELRSLMQRFIDLVKHRSSIDDDRTSYTSVSTESPRTQTPDL